MSLHLKSKFKTLNNPYLILLVGIPLSGKTTFCNEFLSDIDNNVNIISRDQLVMDVYGSDDYDKSFKNVNQSEVNKQLEKAFRETGKNHDNVIIDMTNLSRKRRRFNMSFYDESYYKIAVVFPFLSDNEYKRRNAYRKETENKFIPDHVVINMKQSYQTVDKSEGFNRVIWL